MRKFLISLLLLFIAMGTVFFFGYIPFRLNQGNYGVVYTKNQWLESSCSCPRRIPMVLAGNIPDQPYSFSGKPGPTGGPP